MVQWAPKLKNGQKLRNQTQKSTAGSRVPLLLGLSTFVVRYFVGVANPHPLRPCRRGDG